MPESVDNAGLPVHIRWSPADLPETPRLSGPRQLEAEHGEVTPFLAALATAQAGPVQPVVRSRSGAEDRLAAARLTRQGGGLFRQGIVARSRGAGHGVNMKQTAQTVNRHDRGLARVTPGSARILSCKNCAFSVYFFSSRLRTKTGS